MSVEPEALLPAFSILKNNPRRVSHTYSEEFFYLLLFMIYLRNYRIKKLIEYTSFYNLIGL